MNYYSTPPTSDEIWHHGIKGMRWGVRRYENSDGTLTPAGKKRYGTKENYEKKRAKRKKVAKVAGITAATLAALYANHEWKHRPFKTWNMKKDENGQSRKNYYIFDPKNKTRHVIDDSISLRENLKRVRKNRRMKQKPLENTNRVLNDRDSEQRRNNLIRWVTKLDNAYYDKKQKIDDNYYKNKSMSSYDYNKAQSQLMKKYDRISKNIYSKYRSTYGGFKA